MTDPLDTADQMASMAQAAIGKRLNVSDSHRQGISMSETLHNLPVPLNFKQQPLLIEHSVDGAIIPQRPRDGYIDATALCQEG